MCEYPSGSVGASGDLDLIERIKSHFGEEYLAWTPLDIELILEQRDPRSYISWKFMGDFTATGGSGPKQNE